jgi:enoyl-CoA hydratase/carnithine racemase
MEMKNNYCIVTINRTQDRNSLNSPIMDEITDAIKTIGKLPDIKAIAFTGAGDEYFIGGADGIEMMQFNQTEAKKFSEKIQKLFNYMESSPLIMVAAINGLCFGGGFEFAMACDIRIASDKARIGLPEVKVGLIPGGGGTQRLPKLIGEGKAMEMILTGRLYKGEEAEKLGIINKVVKHRELINAIDELLKKIFRNPEYLYPLVKKSVYSSRLPLNIGLKMEQEQFSHCFNYKYFYNLMIHQIKQGKLQTTENITHLIERGTK